MDCFECSETLEWDNEEEVWYCSNCDYEFEEDELD